IAFSGCKRAQGGSVKSLDNFSRNDASPLSVNNCRGAFPVTTMTRIAISIRASLGMEIIDTKGLRPGPRASGEAGAGIPEA
ncbi:MAG: hypothetical protein ACXWH1_09985, partial [Thermoanaerobaculia bacterium]